MRKVDDFYSKIISNEKLVYFLGKLKGEIWNNLILSEKIAIFNNIADEICGFYPELGKFNFNFVFLDDNTEGQDSEQGTFINARMLEEEDCFSMLATFFHELRHFYQRKAAELYENTGVVHKLFEKEDLGKIADNMKRSPLYLTSNYIVRTVARENEYFLQPMEYDAEKFSYDIMRRLAREFYKDKNDIDNCIAANEQFADVYKIYRGNRHEIIEFDKLHFFNYQDLINENKQNFKQEKKTFDLYMQKLECLESLDIMTIFTLMAPPLIDKYDDFMKIKVLNAYLSYYGCSERIYMEDGECYFNGCLFNINDSSIYSMVEPLFLFVANQKTLEISRMDDSEIKCKFEKDIKVNISGSNNFIQESKNPLLYRLQPYILHRDSFVKNEYLRMVKGIDCLYDGSYSYFLDFNIFIKKYDSSSFIKKAEILLGKNFRVIYDGIMERMTDDLNEKRR
jgi:hypothetical protein